MFNKYNLKSLYQLLIIYYYSIYYTKILLQILILLKNYKIFKEIDKFKITFKIRYMICK